MVPNSDDASVDCRGSDTIGGLSHVGLIVSSIDRAVEWFTNVLGLQLMTRQRQDNAYTRRLVGMDAAVLEVAEFCMPSTTSAGRVVTLELIEYVQPQVRPAEGSHSVTPSHISFMVSDIHSEYERLTNCGVAFVSPPVRITEGVNTAGFVCYFTGPDGIGLELFQPPGFVDGRKR